jgi:hypothetical protein
MVLLAMTLGYRPIRKPTFSLALFYNVPMLHGGHNSAVQTNKEGSMGTCLVMKWFMRILLVFGALRA